MRFLTLKLIAFGPFTDRELDFSHGQPGFHLIYGTNEAGKSTALRALQQALFGIDMRSTDSFVHPYSSMRVGMSLERSDGARLDFVRRKANKSSLRLADDQTPLADEVLTQWLQNIDRHRFDSMFGIDHERLRLGGDEIVRGQGNVAETLFSAAAGVTNLQKIRQTLQDEYEKLYLPAGRSQRYNELQKQLKDLRAERDKLMLPSESWTKLQEELEATGREKASLVEQLSEVKRELARLARFANAIPVLSPWKQAQESLRAVQTAILLPTDFETRFRDAVQKLELHARFEEEARKGLDELDEQLQSLPATTSILQEEPLIDSLKERLGSHRKAQSDRPGLVKERDLALRAGQDLVARLTNGATEQRPSPQRLSPDQEVRIEELSSQQQAVRQQRETLHANVTRLRQALAEDERALAALPPGVDARVLGDLIARIQKHGDLDDQQTQATAQLAAGKAALITKLVRLPYARATLEEHERLVCPTDETLDRFEGDYQQFEVQRRELTRVHGKLVKARSALEHNLQEIDAQGRVPTLDELQAARTVRDTRWSEVRQSWLVDRVARPELAEAFTTDLHHADQLGDQLRNEAERVTLKAKFLSDRESAQRDVAECDAEIATLEAAQAKWQADWREVWAGVTAAPTTPAEMRRWLQDHRALLAELQTWRQRQTEHTERAGLIGRSILELDHALAQTLSMEPAVTAEPSRPASRTNRGASTAALFDLDEAPVSASPTLSYALMRAADAVKFAEDQRQTRADLSKSIQKTNRDLLDATANLDRAEQAFTEWRQAWSSAVAALGLTPDVSPGEARATLHALKQLADHRRSADDLEVRISGIDRDAEEFRQDVLRLCQRVLPALTASAVDEQMTALMEELERARSAKQQRKAIEKQRQQHDAAQKKAAGELMAARAALATLCAEAGGASREELPGLILQSDTRRRCESELQTYEEQLRASSAGAPLDQFIAALETFDADSLPAERDRLQQAQAQLEARLSDLDQSLGKLGAQREQMHGQGDAAEKTEQCALVEAELRGLVRHYAVLRLSAAVLQQGIERYRERHQGPMLSRASHLFAQLTGGSFQGLRSDVQDEKWIIVGVRPEGGKPPLIKVDEMSDGTRDQLYLALRLALLEAHQEHHEPMPFIVDDILLHFDDDRAQAALHVLGDLSRKTQVLFFTHHHRLKELAETTIPAEQLIVHTLGA